jgi:hypothetical protein
MLLAGADISPWHDIPLQGKDGTYNFVCEIPKETSAKMEVATVGSAGSCKASGQSEVLIKMLPSVGSLALSIHMPEPGSVRARVWLTAFCCCFYCF